MRLRVSRTTFALLWLGLAPASADPALDALVAAYPDFLAGYDEKDLIWKDGGRMPLSDGRPDKTFDELLDNPDIKDQLAIPYPLGTDLRVPAVNEDPGRIRNEKFFLKMYGDCRKGEVAKRLAPVAWMPERHGSTLRVTSVNGVNARLADTIKRHFYRWKDSPDRIHHTYPKCSTEIAVRITPPNSAQGAQDNLIRRLNPRDNLLIPADPF